MKVIKILSICLIAALLSAICCVAVVSAETIYTHGDYSYTRLDGNNISIYSWEGTGALELPDKLDVYTIKEIRNNCFNSRDDLTTVDLHAASFLTRIGIGAFRDSTVSGELNIPPQLKTVATSAFQNCDSLEILDYNAMSGVVSSQCFYDCDSLREVYLPDSLTGIESHAFADCDALSLVRIGENVTAISDTAFSDDDNLVIYCYTNSYAHQFAVDNGYEFVLIDAPAKEYFVGKSLSLDGDIGVNFYLDLTPDEAQSAMVNFSWNVNDQIKTASVKPKVSGGYKATCRIAPAEMTGSILAELLINGEKVDETRYSAKQYADVILSDSFQASYKGTGARSYENLRNLVLNMLSFGSRAQTAFEVNLDTLADKDSGYTPEVVRAEDIAVADADMTEGLDNYGLFYAGSTLVCLTETTIRHYYRVTEQDKFNAVKNSIYIEGKPASPVEKNGSIYFEINNIPAADLDKDYTLKIGSNEYKYSALNYIKTALPSDKVEDDVKNLIQVLYLYNLAANAYFAK